MYFFITKFFDILEELSEREKAGDEPENMDVEVEDPQDQDVDWEPPKERYKRKDRERHQHKQEPSISKSTGLLFDVWVKTIFWK